VLAIITGASSGIGREFAYQLAAKQYDLVLVARRKDRLDEVKAVVEKEYGVHVTNYDMDLSNLDNCILLHEKTKNLEIDLFINNAGFGQVGEFTAIPLQRELDMIDLNIKSLHTLMKLYLSTMTQGVILNVGSMAAFLPTPLLAAYAATKSYVVSLSRAVNQELKKSGSKVSVLALCPGPVATEFGEVAQVTKKGLPGIEAKQCVREALRGIKRRKDVIAPSFAMKFMRFLLRIVPTKWVLAISYRVQQTKN